MKVCSSAQTPHLITCNSQSWCSWHIPLYLSLPLDKIVSKCACVHACMCAVVTPVPLDKIVSGCACVRACTCGAVAPVPLDKIVSEHACVRACTCGVVALVPLDKIVNECACTHVCCCCSSCYLNSTWTFTTAFSLFFYSSNLHNLFVLSFWPCPHMHMIFFFKAN